MNKDIQQLIKKIKKTDWRVEQGAKHYKAYSPDGETIVLISSTISDAGAIKKIKADLKRNGLTLN